MRRARRTATATAARRPNNQAAPRRRASSAAAARAFWGDPRPSAAAPAEPIRPAADPSAVVRSLGPPPLAGHETAAEYYFNAIYDKAVGLAGALAAAGGLLDDAED